MQFLNKRGQNIRDVKIKTLTQIDVNTRDFELYIEYGRLPLNCNYSTRAADNPVVLLAWLRKLKPLVCSAKRLYFSDFRNCCHEAADALVHGYDVFHAKLNKQTPEYKTTFTAYCFSIV
jgi:hypothetical protein